MAANDKRIGFLYGRKQTKDLFRVLFLVFPTTTGSLKEVTDELKAAYFQLNGLQLLGLAQGTCGDMQLCQKSKEVFFSLRQDVGKQWSISYLQSQWCFNP